MKTSSMILSLPLVMFLSCAVCAAVIPLDSTPSPALTSGAPSAQSANNNENANMVFNNEPAPAPVVVDDDSGGTPQAEREHEQPVQPPTGNTPWHPESAPSKDKQRPPPRDKHDHDTPREQDDQHVAPTAPQRRPAEHAADRNHAVPLTSTLVTPSPVSSGDPSAALTGLSILNTMTSGVRTFTVARPAFGASVPTRTVHTSTTAIVSPTPRPSPSNTLAPTTSKKTTVALNIVGAVIILVVLVAILACFRDKMGNILNILPCVRTRRRERERAIQRLWLGEDKSSTSLHGHEKARSISPESPPMPSTPPDVLAHLPTVRREIRRGRRDTDDARLSIITTSTNEYITPVSASPPQPKNADSRCEQQHICQSHTFAAQMSPGARSVDTLPSYYSPRDSSRPTLSLPPPPPGLPCATHRSHTLAKSRPQPFVTLPPAPLSPRSLRHPSIGPDWRAQRKTYILPSQAMSVGKEHSLADSTESLTSNLTYHRFPLPPTHRDYRAGAYVNKPRPEFVTGAF